jgi:hypothetical protein
MLIYYKCLCTIVTVVEDSPRPPSAPLFFTPTGDAHPVTQAVRNVWGKTCFRFWIFVRVRPTDNYRACAAFSLCVVFLRSIPSFLYASVVWS